MLTTNNEIFRTEFEDVNKNNFQQIKNKAIKIGYADGVNDGRESVFQNGFDQGYKDGFSTGLKSKKFIYFFKHLNTEKVHNKELIEEKEEFSRLPVTLLKPLRSNMISHECMEETTEKLAKQMPIATKLLSIHSSTSNFS